jgi:hypothetical protein
MSTLLIELNEINFEFVARYCAMGKLPTMARLIHDHGLSTTVSETRYEELEPWIQWVTAHTGLSLADHGIWRLGDIRERPLDQIWEVLERQDIKVGAISPMNALNRCRNPAFFMPDPWTTTTTTGAGLARLYPPVAAAVNNNADARFTPAMMARLCAGLVAYAAPSSCSGYLADLVGAARKRPWRKAMLLDRLLADVFVKEVKASRPGFASLFLNAGAHIQHHYLFNSAACQSDQNNPAWYVEPSADPVFEVYDLYDRIVARVRDSFPNSRIMLATGLHQDPHPKLTLYWRLRDHAAFLARHGVPFQRVEPRMSRDFVIFCRSAEEAGHAQSVLETLVGPDHEPLFNIDNRGESLFVELIWAKDLDDDFVYYREQEPMRGLRQDVAFVAIKNGQHNGTGYFVDTGAKPAEAGAFPLTALPERIAAACGAAWPGPAASPALVEAE